MTLEPKFRHFDLLNVYNMLFVIFLCKGNFDKIKWDIKGKSYIIKYQKTFKNK